MDYVVSYISNIVNQRLQPASELPSGVLMRWNHEPIAYYQRNKQKVFYFIWPFLPFGALIFLFSCHITLGIKNFQFLILLAITSIVGIVITFFRQLPSDQWIELTKDKIQQRLRMPGGGGYFFSWSYKDIECCTYYRDSYRDVKFSVLKILIKDERESRVIIVPDKISLESVLQILRDNGVKLIEETNQHHA